MTGSVRIKVILKRVRATIVAVETAISITYSEFVFVALGMQHAMRMLHIIICGLPLLYIIFPHHIKGTILGGK